ncbi:MAG: radical SAM protein [Thermoanaerobacteraceae bacterium]|nr:radical SAM protein [Thermoanaerobacteraceae bacterium]
MRQCFSSLYDMGTTTIGITGGEPMLHKDILDIIYSIPDGIEAQLFTTGHNIDVQFASKIKDSNLTRCIVSLDHYDEEIVCGLRHNPNAYKEALKAIRVLTEQNIYTAVTVCITNELLKPGALQKYFEFIQFLNINELRIIMPIPQGNLKGQNFSHLYSDTIKFVKQFKKEHSSSAVMPIIVNFCEIESSSYLGCEAGVNYMAINNNGCVTPCVAVPLSFGNIYKDNLKDIFERMGEFFPIPGRICYGKILGRVLSREKVDTTITPIPTDFSLDIAKQCNVLRDRPAFFKCFDCRGGYES